MKQYFFLFLIFFTTLNVFSEDIPKFKFGKVTKHELEINSCELDSGAHAFFLFDKGSSEFSYIKSKGFRIGFKRHCRIKILSKEGYDNADFKILFYEASSSAKGENVTGIKAITYNLENGKIVKTKLDRDDVFIEKKNKNWRYKSFTMPNVKEGSVLEVEYTLSSDFLWNLPSWHFQHYIPCRWSMLDVRIPEYFNYNKEMKGYVPLYKNEKSASGASINILNSKKPRNSSAVPQTSFSANVIDYQVYNSVMVAKDVPAFKREPYIDAVDNYLSSVSFELSFIRYPSEPMKSYTSTWEEICKDLKKNEKFGLQLKASGISKDKIKELNLTDLSDVEKTKSIFNEVKKLTKWDESVSIYSDGIRKIIKVGVGSSGDINMLLINMLDAAGLNVRPVVLKTRNSGRLPLSYPSLSELNYLVAAVKIDDKLVMLDATEDMMPYNFLPKRCLNDKGILINKDNTIEWVDLSKNSFSKFASVGSLEINENGEISGQIKERRFGYEALNRRLEIDIEEEETIKDFEDENEGLLVEAYNVKNKDDVDNWLEEKLDVIIEEKVVVAGDMMYLNPCLFEAIDENPFKIDDRKYPVNFANKSEDKITYTIKIPDNWTIVSVPDKLVIGLENKAGYFQYSISRMSNTLIFTQTLKIDNPVILPKHYRGLKEFFRQVVEKQQEQIVLKKI